jgi:acetylglutamate/LysW-gamma-L-alpha-aminoadipate kinase
MIVVKLGGKIATELQPSLISDLKCVWEREETIVVHGGGELVTDVARKLGKDQSFVVSPGGIRSRYTDEEDITIFTMVMCGIVNKTLVSKFIKGGIRTIGISGVDMSIIRAKRKRKIIIMDNRNRKRIIDGGFTGKIDSVAPDCIRGLIGMGLLPVISPIALGEEYELLNIDADMATARLAASLLPSRVVFLTDVPGILDGDEVVDMLNQEQAKLMISKLGFGMNRKLMAAIDAVNSGVSEALISSGHIENPISSTLSHEVGTRIVSK